MRKNLNITMLITRQITRRNILFIFFNIVTIIMFYEPMRNLIVLSLHNNYYSHIILIPFISGYFMYVRRKTIFSDIHYSYAAGIILIIVGGILSLTGKTQGIKFEQNDYLSLMTFSSLIFWMGGFVLFYGIRAFRTGAFPLLFLIFLVPIPDFIREWRQWGQVLYLAKDRLREEAKDKVEEKKNSRGQGIRKEIGYNSFEEMPVFQQSY